MLNRRHDGRSARRGRTWPAGCRVCHGSADCDSCKRDHSARRSSCVPLVVAAVVVGLAEDPPLSGAAGPVVAELTDGPTPPMSVKARRCVPRSRRWSAHERDRGPPGVGLDVAHAARPGTRAPARASCSVIRRPSNRGNTCTRGSLTGRCCVAAVGACQLAFARDSFRSEG
jgi:hypothetical protein